VAHSLSAKKRIRQSVKHRASNRARKVELKNAVRDFKEALSVGDKAKSAETLKAAVKTLDKVAAKGTIHKNTASRKKSRLQRKLNAIGKTA
jgi:small subunit ribosomal protein S20